MNITHKPRYNESSRAKEYVVISEIRFIRADLLQKMNLFSL